MQFQNQAKNTTHPAQHWLFTAFGSARPSAGQGAEITTVTSVQITLSVQKKWLKFDGPSMFSINSNH